MSADFWYHPDKNYMEETAPPCLPVVSRLWMPRAAPRFPSQTRHMACLNLHNIMLHWRCKGTDTKQRSVKKAWVNKGCKIWIVKSLSKQGGTGYLWTCPVPQWDLAWNPLIILQWIPAWLCYTGLFTAGIKYNLKVELRSIQPCLTDRTLKWSVYYEGKR